MDNKESDFDRIKELLHYKDSEGKNKRKKKTDWVSKTATILSLSAWTIMIAVWAILSAAAPERERRFITSFFDMQFGTAPLIRTRWDYTLVYIAYILLLVSLGTCVIAFLLNRQRMKRKRDKYKKSILVAGGITIITFVIFLIRFWYALF